MREIKFRAWSTIEEPRMIELNRGLIEVDLVDTPKWKVMQFTGLKDKNGREIYEGDIVSNNNGFGCHSSWGDATDETPDKRIVLWDEEDVAFKLCYLLEKIRDRGHSGYCFCKSNEKEFEIIGNIYEHPHLLNAKESTEKEPK